MKKVIILLVASLCIVSVKAQDQSQSSSPTSKGNILFEVGASAFGETSLKHGSSTGFNLLNANGSTIFSIGAEGGYFVQDNSAIKVGLGYTDVDFTTFFTYKVGFKHYANGNVPIQIDITGATNEDQDTGFGTFETPDPLWLGLQLGYAAFLSDNIAFEPTMRYNVTLNNDFTDENIFELKFNFVIFF